MNLFGLDHKQNFIFVLTLIVKEQKIRFLLLGYPTSYPLCSRMSLKYSCVLVLSVKIIALRDAPSLSISRAQLSLT